MKFLLLFCTIFLSLNSFKANTIVSASNLVNQEINYTELTIINKFIESDSLNNKQLFKTKLIAVSLAVTLGYFGVHRLYLGTKSIVPIAYTLTLGGGGFILPVLDIIYIIAAKDINQITNNDFVFMWNKKKKADKNTEL